MTHSLGPFYAIEYLIELQSDILETLPQHRAPHFQWCVLFFQRGSKGG